MIKRHLVTACALAAAGFLGTVPVKAVTLGVPASVNLPPGQTGQVAVSLDDGSGVSAAQFTLTFSPATSLEVVGVAAGSLLSPAAEFTITTNPGVIDPSSPTSGPVTVLVDSAGTSMASGPGSLVILSVRPTGSCTGSTSMTLTNERVTKDLASQVPTAMDGVATCVAEAAVVEMSAASGLAGCPGDVVVVPIELSDGTDVSAGQLTLSLSPATGLEIVGVAAGSLLDPPGAFQITTNPAVVSDAVPTQGPLTVLVDSTGTSMAPGPGSLVEVRVRIGDGCTGTHALDLANASITRNLASEVPLVVDGSVACGGPACDVVGGDVPVVTVGDVVAAPGSDVEVPILLATAAGCEASSLTVDVAYDPLVLLPPLFCTATPGDAAAGFAADCNEVEAGLVRLILLTFEPGRTLGDGVVATLQFHVFESAPIGWRVPLEDLACSLSQSSPLRDCGARCESGEMLVLGLPGDWNRDGRVSITEVQRAVNCVLGRPVFDGCAAADVDGSGVVTGLELQCVVNNYLAIECRSL